MLILITLILFLFSFTNAEFRMKLNLNRTRQFKPNRLLAELNCIDNILSKDNDIKLQNKENNDKINDLRCCSPYATFAIALIPGAVVHGAGHFYIGDKKTGWTLAKLEIISIGLFGIFTYTALSEGGRGDIAVLSLISSAGLFLGTWFYDIIGATYKTVNHPCNKN